MEIIFAFIAAIALCLPDDLHAVHIRHFPVDQTDIKKPLLLIGRADQVDGLLSGSYIAVLNFQADQDQGSALTGGWIIIRRIFLVITIPSPVP